MQLVEIIPVDEKIEIHRGPDVAQDAQRKTSDRRVSNSMMIEFAQQGLQHALEIHAAIVDARMRRRKPAAAMYPLTPGRPIE